MFRDFSTGIEMKTSFCLIINMPSYVDYVVSKLRHRAVFKYHSSSELFLNVY